MATGIKLSRTGRAPATGAWPAAHQSVQQDSYWHIRCRGGEGSLPQWRKEPMLNEFSYGTQTGKGFESHLLALGLAIVVLINGAGEAFLDAMIQGNLVTGQRR
jgi:hypothetical protein